MAIEQLEQRLTQSRQETKRAQAEADLAYDKQAEALADARQCAEHSLKAWREAQADCAAMRAAIEHIYLRQQRFVSEGGPTRLVCAACWQPIEPLDTGIGPKHAPKCIVDVALSGAAGKALLDELQALRAETARCMALITEHDARVMQPVSGMPYEYPVQLAADLLASQAEAAALREALLWARGSIEFQPGSRGYEGWQRVVAPALAGTAGQGLLDELTVARDAERVWQEEAMQARQLAATMTDSWQQSQADCAAMREALLDIRNHCGEPADGQREWHFIDAIREQAQAALSSTAGQALLQERAVLQAVATAAQRCVNYCGRLCETNYRCDLRAALAALDARRGEASEPATESG